MFLPLTKIQIWSNWIRIEKKEGGSYKVLQKILKNSKIILLKEIKQLFRIFGNIWHSSHYVFQIANVVNFKHTRAFIGAHRDILENGILRMQLMSKFPI